MQFYPILCPTSEGIHAGSIEQILESPLSKSCQMMKCSGEHYVLLILSSRFCKLCSDTSSTSGARQNKIDLITFL